MKVFLRKQKQNGDIEFAPVYFKSTTKTVTNFHCNLNKSFHEVLYRNENWINKGSGWIIKSVDAEYVNIHFIVRFQEAHLLNCLLNKKAH